MTIKRNSHRNVLFLSIIIILSTLSGCIKVDSVVYLNEDGSGRVEVTELITAQGIDLLANLGKSGQIPNIDITSYFTEIDVSELKARAKNISDGIDFMKVEPVKLSDGSIGKITTYEFKDINNVKIINKNANNRTIIQFTYTRDMLNIATNITEREESDLMHRVASLKGIPSGLKSAFTGMEFNVYLRTAKAIKNTNALFLNPDLLGITIIEADIGRLVASSEAIDSLNRYDRNKPDNFKETLAPFSEWLKVEYQKDLTIRFK